MRRQSRFSVSTAVAVTAATVAVLALMFPGVGFGQSSGIHGGSPTAVYMNKNPDICATVDNAGGAVIRQDVTIDAESHFLVYFTFEWGSLNDRIEGLVDIALLASDGTVVGGSDEWGFPGSRLHTSGTVMWSFEEVSPGMYEVYGAARVDATPAGGLPSGEVLGSLEDCALTVFVIPAAMSPTPSATQSPPSPSPPPSPPSVA